MSILSITVCDAMIIKFKEVFNSVSTLVKTNMESILTLVWFETLSDLLIALLITIELLLETKDYQ